MYGPSKAFFRSPFGLRPLAAAAVLVSSALLAGAGPASAQAPLNIVNALDTLPREMQRNSMKRYRYFYDQRAYPFQRIPSGAFRNAIDQHVAQFGALRQTPGGDANLTFNQNLWTELGPAPIGSSPTNSGRTNSIAIDPTNTSTIYLGAATGGVWKTVDGGANWKPVTDSQCSLAMGSIAIDPASPQTVYAGTGEENFSGDSYYGCGVLKTTDGGVTWTQTGASVFAPAGPGASIGKIAINPASSSTLLVASSFGLYRSTNAGASYSQVLTGISTDVAFDPSNANIVYSANGNVFGSASNGVYKSTNGGATWSQLAGGLPTSLVGRVMLAVAPSAPSTIYATIQNTSTFGLLGIWKSTDSGATWSKLTASNASCATQCWYDMAIWVDPTNANTVYFSGFSIYKSIDGGASFVDIGAGVHVDHHAFAFLPGSPSTIFAGSDGGVFKSTNAGASWTSLNANLGITQFYGGMAVHPTNPAIFLSGTQDNGTLLTTGSKAWTPVIGGDGGFSEIDFATPTTAYGETQWGGSFSGPRKTTTLGGANSFSQAISGINLADSAQFIPPLVMSKTNSTTLYFGTNKVYKTINAASTWTPSTTTLTGRVTHMAEAPSNSNIVYAGTTAGLVYKSIDGNATYAALSGLPNRTPSKIAVHPTDANTAFVTFSGFTLSTPTQHVYKTTNGGTSWTNISGNLPDVPVNSIVLDPSAPTAEIIIGTDLGVYRTHDGGTTWSPFNPGLPFSPVLDLKYTAGSGVLVAATHGRGAWSAVVKSVVAHDFDADGKGDILWRDTLGIAVVSRLSGASIASSSFVANVPTSYAVAGTGDFNGDGNSDILWRDATTGNTVVSLLKNQAITSSTLVATLPAPWTVAGLGDFDGNRTTDILWRNTTTNAYVLSDMNGPMIKASTLVGQPPATWSVVGVGDFNGDNQADILWRDSASNSYIISLMNGATILSSTLVATVPANWTVQTVADFNGDGAADILWNDGSGRYVVSLVSGGTSIVSSTLVATLPSPWTFGVAAAVNGSLQNHLVWRDSSNGNVVVSQLAPAGTSIASSTLVGAPPTNWSIQSANAK